MSESLKNAIRVIEEAQKSAQKVIETEASQHIAAVAASLKEKHGLDLLAYVFVGYVPYFNDGEPCEYRANEIGYITVTSLKKWCEDEGEEFPETQEAQIEFIRDASMYAFDCSSMAEADFGNLAYRERAAAVKNAVGPSGEFFEALMDSKLEDTVERIFGSHSKVVFAVDGNVYVEDISGDHD